MPETATTWTLLITDWHPARANQWDGRHWSVRAKLKKSDRELIGVYSRFFDIPKATGPRRVSLTLTLTKGMRRPDPDAFFKSLLDALVHAGLLVDDGPKWCQLGSVEYDRGERRRTIITLEDLP